MAIREIKWSVSKDLRSISPNTPQDGGVQGEHNVTKAVFELPEGCPLLEGYTLRFGWVNAAGSYDPTEPLPVEEGKVSFLLPRQWTQYGGTNTLSLVAEKNGEVAYTLDARVFFHSRQTALQEERKLVEVFMQQQCDDAAASAELADKAASRASGSAGIAITAKNDANTAAAAAAEQATAAETRAKQAATKATAAQSAAGQAGQAATKAETAAANAETAAANAAQYLSSVKSDAQSAAASAAQAAADAKTVSNGISVAQLAASSAGQAAGAASAARSDAQNHAANASAAKNAAEKGATTATQAAADAQSAAERAEEAAASLVVDDALSFTSTNPVQNKVVQAAVNGITGTISAIRDAAKTAYEEAQAAKELASAAGGEGYAAKQLIQYDINPRLATAEEEIATLKENGGGGSNAIVVHPDDDGSADYSSYEVCQHIWNGGCAVLVEAAKVFQPLFASPSSVIFVSIDGAGYLHRRELANTKLIDLKKINLNKIGDITDIGEKADEAMDAATAANNAIGAINTALDSIIDIQQSLIEGDGNITEEEVDGMINAALEVIENGTY